MTEKEPRKFTPASIQQTKVMLTFITSRPVWGDGRPSALFSKQVADFLTWSARHVKKLEDSKSQVTFETKDLKEAAKHFNFAYQHARWIEKDDQPLSSAACQDVHKFFAWTHEHMLDMEDNIMEVVAVTSPPEDVKTNKKAKK